MNTRRDTILAAAQRELIRSHQRRTSRRRRTVAGGAAMMIVAAMATTAILLRPTPSPMPELARGPESQSAGTPVDLTDHASPGQTPPPTAPNQSTPPTRSTLHDRFEIVSNTSPTPGFAEVLGDADLSMVLGQLTTPTGVAVIAGRTHLVSNLPSSTGERTR